ncbi:MAG: tetratricopeptide repeat protein [Alphaproteobacteria bacterium]|nr:tetratricopeptide repeat protein [Alphaproteobacteria bacterium]
MRLIPSALSLFTYKKLCLVASAAVVGLTVAGCVVKNADEGAPPSMAKAETEEAEAQSLSSPGSYLAGLHAARHGEAGAAGDFLLRALAADPDNLDLLNRAFLLMMEEGRFDEANSLAERATEISPEATLPILTLALSDVVEGDLHLAEVKLRSLPEEGFNKFLKPLMLSWVLSGQGLGMEAETALAPLSENSGFAVLRDLHLGLIQDVSGDKEKAMESYENALLSGPPSSFRLVEIFGNFFERSGHSEKAMEIYRNYLENVANASMIEPALARLEDNKTPEPVVNSVREGMAEALFNISSALHQEGATKMALIYARLAGFLRPDFPINQALLAEIYELQGRKETAKALYESIRPGTPHRWMADLRVALILDELNRTEEALAALRALSEDRPERVEALVSMGDILRTRERFKEAIAAYDEAVARIDKMEPRHWALLYARGIALERAKLWQRAEDDLLRALELQPGQPYVLNYLGYSWVDQGINLERAREMIEQAVKLKPRDGYIVDSLGWVLFRFGEFEGAVRELERAVELRPHDSTINDHLGDAYWRTGRRNEARFQWRRALNLDPTPELAAALEAKLENGLGDAENGSVDSANGQGDAENGLGDAEDKPDS